MEKAPMVEKTLAVLAGLWRTLKFDWLFGRVRSKSGGVHAIGMSRA